MKEFISAPAFALIVENIKRLPESPRRAEALRWLSKQQEDAKHKPLVFWFEGSDYVTVGREGSTQTFEHPGPHGLDYAWHIFAHGIAAQHAINAEDILDNPGRRPASALYNALVAAAAWLEDRAHCPALAAAVRGISISKTGVIHTPSNRPYISLNRPYPD